MDAVELCEAPVGQFPEIQKFQARRIAARIAASDSVAALVAEMAFGPTRRDDDVLLLTVTTSRCAAAAMGGR